MPHWTPAFAGVTDRQVLYANVMIRNTRPISWIKAALREFEKFPAGAQREILRALTVTAEGRKADTAKPMKGLGSSVYVVP